MTAPGMLGGRHGPKDALRLVAGPLLEYFDKRFQQVLDRIDERMNELYGRVATEVETMSEMTLVMERFVEVAGRRIDGTVATMQELCGRLEHRARASSPDGFDPSRLEAAFALSAAAGLAPGARILRVDGGAGDLAGALTAAGYEVTSLDGADGPPMGSGDLEATFDCALWMPADTDQHILDLLRKWLGPQGQLVFSLRDGTAASGFVDEALRDWSVLDHVVLTRTADSGWRALSLVRATPRP